MARLRPSRHWTIAPDGDGLRLSAGADVIYTVEDLGSAATNWMLDAWASDCIARDDAGDEARRAIDEMVGAGVLVPEVELRDAARPTLGIVWVGEPHTGLAARLGADAALAGLELDEDPDLDIVIRTTGSLADLAATPVRRGSALLLDCAYDHTVSLGPLVVYGETACLHCYAERVTVRWSDPQPPVEPRVLQDIAFISALTTAEATLAITRRSSLINRSVAYHRELHTVVREALHRAPGCLHCDPAALTTTGVRQPTSVAPH